MYFAGGFDEVKSFCSNLYWNLDVEDNVFAILKNSRNNVLASLHSTMTQWRYLFSLEIFLEKGALVLNGLKTTSGAYGDEDLAIKRNQDHPEEGRFESEERITYHTDTSWDSEMQSFFASIEEDSPVLLGNSTDALKLMEIIDKIYQNR
jgi:predicted dehydrogenase